MDKFQLGAHLRGDLELDRENMGKAFDAYKLSPDFPGSGRRIAQILEESNAAPRDIVQAFIDAYQSGDLAALPWVIERLEDIAAPQSEIASYRTELDLLLSENNAYVLGSIARTQIFRGDFEDGLRNLAKAILAGESQSKTTLAIFLIDPNTEPKIVENLKKKKYFDLPNWPVTPEFNLHTQKGFSSQAIDFIESLLEQGEEQKFYSANRTLLFLNITTKPANWTLMHLKEITTNPAEWTKFWDDPEYLFFLGREAVIRDTNVNLNSVLNRLSEFGIEDLASEIYGEIRDDLNSQSLFDDEDWKSDYGSSPTPPKIEVSPMINAKEYLGEKILIYDLVQLVDSGQSEKYSESADNLLKAALLGNIERFLPAAQIIEFATRRANDHGNFKNYSFMLQSIGFSELLEGNPRSAVPFLEYLADYLLRSHSELFERHLFKIYYADGVSKKTISSISKSFGKYVDFWESGRSIERYADEIIAGNFSNLKSFQEVIKRSYTDYMDFDSEVFNSDQIWYVGVHEAIDLALERGNGLQSREFIDFVISIGNLDSHLACKLLYQDLWGAPDNRAEYNSINQIQRIDKWALDGEILRRISQLGECDEQECLGLFGLISLHPKVSSDLLAQFFGKLNEFSISENVEWSIAHNSNTPSEILIQLAHRTNFAWGMVSEMSAIVEPLNEFNENSHYVQAYIAWAVADNPSSPEPALSYLRSIRADSPEWLAESNSIVSIADAVQAIRKRAMR